MIYKNGTTIKAYKGNSKPVNIYSGSNKIAGWKFDTKSGASLQFSKSYNDNVNYLEIDGKSNQVQTVQGKNLVDSARFAPADGSCTVSLNGANANVTVASLNKYGSAQGSKISLIANKTYYFSCYATLSRAVNYSSIVIYTWGTTTPITNKPLLPNTTRQFVTFSYTPSYNVDVYIMLYTNYGEPITAPFLNCLYENIMLSENNVAYERFVANSPSPNYPSQINSVNNFNLVSNEQTINFPYALRSLPDGTKDYIEIDDIAKTAKLVQNVGEVVFNGTENWITFFQLS